MIRSFTTLPPEEIANPGERVVARVLVEQLPCRVEVFHGFNWLASDRRSTVQQGECDFVLIDRKKGALFVEFKGGSPDLAVVLKPAATGLVEGRRTGVVRRRSSGLESRQPRQRALPAGPHAPVGAATSGKPVFVRGVDGGECRASSGSASAMLLSNWMEMTWSSTRRTTGGSRLSSWWL